MNLPTQLVAAIDAFPHRSIFVTVSGAHLYGFPSPDSDYDLRGCHLLPARSFLGIREPEETAERMSLEAGVELDFVSHDLRKFARMLIRPNGYVLEQLLSPMIVRTSPEHEEMKRLVPGLLTRHHAHHYLGFARNQWQMFEQRPRVKTLLYVYRVLLTGIHLMRSGIVQPSLPDLLDEYPQEGLRDLIAAKVEGAETLPLDHSAIALHAETVGALIERLRAERDASALPERPSAASALDELVVRARLATM